MTAITWSFFEASCTPLNSSHPCAPFTAPLARLILPDTTSSGSASWQGSPVGIPPPMLIGDSNFSFVPTEGNSITPPNYGTQPLCSQLFSPGAICNYSISWNEVDDQLLAVSVNYNTASIAGMRLGLGGGFIASDNTIGGCPVMGTCYVTGVWQSNLAAVPEPGSILLLFGALAAWRLFGRRKAPC